MRVFRYLMSYALLLTGNTTYGQLNAGTFGKVNIASPNAASLGKYGDIPVSYHTGVPNITVPIHTAKQGSLSLAVQLNYHAGGLKVDENASWVGAGWSLQAGGVITRTVKDKPDERRTESLQQLYGHFSNFGIASYLQNQDANSLSAIDQEPDIFSFSFNGVNGKFYFDDSRRAVIVPKQDLKIEYVYHDTLWSNGPGLSLTGIGRSIESFIITTSDGTKYYFGITRDGVSAPYCEPIEVVSSYNPVSGNVTGKVISSWYLYKVESSDGVHKIDLKYKLDKYAFYSYPSSVYGSQSPNANMYYGVKNLMAGVMLSSVVASENTIEFIPGEARQDIAKWATGLDEGMSDAVNETSPVLGSIRINDPMGGCVKKYDFRYGYFEDTSTPALSYFNWINTDKKRLKLNSIQETSGDSSIVIPAYRFEYFDELVPRKLSFGKDHWGFINGATANTMLYPEVFDNSGSINALYAISINNRNAAWPAMRAGTLKKMTYPTGGATIFDYEPNTAAIAGMDQMIGGLRIKSIIDYDSVMTVSNKTYFEYKSPFATLSSGVLFSKPTYIQIFRNDWVKKLNPLGSGGNGCYLTQDKQEVIAREFVLSDNTTRPMETTNGYHIGYEYVKVGKLGNGYSVYQYNLGTSRTLNWGSGIAVTYINNPGPCDPNIPSYPAIPQPYDPYRGELMTESHFDKSGNILVKKEFQHLYQQENLSVPGRIIYALPFSQNNFLAFSYYGHKTYKKIESTIIERQFEPNGTFSEQISKSFFQSNFHNSMTKSETISSLGDTIVKQNKYAFDMHTAAFDTGTVCNGGASDFLAFVDAVFYGNGYNTSFASMTTANAATVYPSLLSDFSQAVLNPRKSLTQCFVNARNKYQQNHNLIKSLSDSVLKPILWLQDNYHNALLETSEWKNSLLLRSFLVRYNNERGDAYGVFPKKMQKIDLAIPSSNFTPMEIGSGNTNVHTDTRYSDLINLVYYKGNPVSQLSRDGVSVAYQWDLRQQNPVVKVVNAYNHQRESLQQVVLNKVAKFTLGSSMNQNKSTTVSFTQTDTADIVFTIGALPPGAKVNAIYTLTGPGQNNIQYYLCNGGSGAVSCSGVPASVTLSGMLPGDYNLTINVSTTFDSYQFQVDAGYTYLGNDIILTGDKEFYYEGFEEILAGGIVEQPYTGSKGHTGTFNVPFVPANGRNYIIQWWNYSGGQWVRNEQPYSANMQLSGTIDEIRVFPSDAQMTTYSYKPGYGLTSMIDANGRITRYEYDKIGRLKALRDQDGNIVKTFEYQYQQNP